MISVIIPLYNKGSRVKRAISSVLNQDYQDFEVVVVDDGSTDDSAQYVHSYKDSRIHYVYKKNGGVSSARNFGFEKSKGEWIYFLDADDELLAGAFSAMMEAYGKHPKCRFFVGGKKKVYSRFPYLLMWRNVCYPAPRNTMLHRTVVEQYGLFDLRMSFYEDQEFMLRMARCGSMCCIGTEVAIYHHDDPDSLCGSCHYPIHEMAFYIPEMFSQGKISVWHKALLYENLEMEILWWQKVSLDEVVNLYRLVQTTYFGNFHKRLHWLRQQLVRHGWM